MPDLSVENPVDKRDNDTAASTSAPQENTPSPVPSFYTQPEKPKNHASRNIVKSDRHTRSSSGQRRKRSDENILTNKKSKPLLPENYSVDASRSESFVSVTSQPDLTTALDDPLLEECMDKIVSKYAYQMLDKFTGALTETNNKIDQLNQEVNEKLTDLTGRIGIIENDHKRHITENAEKILVNENNIISNSTRIVALETALEQEKRSNRDKDMIIDKLDQASRGANMFVAGLNEEQSTKEGFLTFATQALQVPVDLSDIKAMFRIPSEREALYKIIFKSNNVRDKFYNARKVLRNHSNIWFRDDLTRKREVMAKRIG